MIDETHAWPPRATRILAIAAIVAALLACVVVASLHFASDAFLVREGFYCEGCIIARRRCLGGRLDTDMRDGERARCLGIPLGPWRCFKVVSDSPFPQVPCRTH